jgi:dipeptidyl aminopeptidase/acylaminoacyl peptidase
MCLHSKAKGFKVVALESRVAAIAAYKGGLMAPILRVLAFILLSAFSPLAQNAQVSGVLRDSGSAGASPIIRHVAGHELESLPDGTNGRIVEIRGSDGVFLPAYLRTPGGRPPFAVVIVLHGGPAGREGTYALGRSTNPPTGNLVAAGWAVLAIDYRPEPTTPAIVQADVIAAIEAVRRSPLIDGGRVAVLGGSRGGGILSRLASRVDVRCAVLCAPALLDLIAISKAAARGEPVEPMVKKIVAGAEKQYGATMAEIEKNPAQYGYESALTEAPQVRCPILIINGRNDKASPISVVQAYADRLRASGKEVGTYFPENGLHGFYFGHPSITPETGEAARRAVAFVQRHLGR